VLGPIIIVAVLLLIPVAVFISGGVFAAIFGYFLKKDIDAEYEGTEYLQIS
jgi:hypothetical protein